MTTLPDGGLMAAPIEIPGEIETPALVVDLDLFAANLKEMADICHDAGVELLPHTKTHRTVPLALRQLELGADGLTAATAPEVEAFVRGGASRVVMAFPLVGEEKIRRVAALLPAADVTVAIDSIEGARAIGRHMAELGGEIDLFLIVDSGTHRVGVEPVDVGAIGSEIAEVKGVRLSGVITHEGVVYKAEDEADLISRTRKAAAIMTDAAEALREVGHPVDTVSMGCSGSARVAAHCPGITQVRPGIYAFNDLSQVGLGLVGTDRCAARVVATVISHPVSGRACLDAGSKTLSKDLPPSVRGRELFPGFGLIAGMPGWRISQVSEEHGWLRWEGPGDPESLDIGQRVQIIPNHVCTVFSSAGQSIGIQGGAVVDVWPVIPRETEPLIGGHHA
jgi:D-serine deaminase-like pyridoxal phosphate-dependent protein